MYLLNNTNLNFFFLLSAYLVYPVLCDLQSGFSQGCYSACPRKIQKRDRNYRQQTDKQWIQCLKQCHQINSWKFIVIVSLIVLTIITVCVVIYVCWGEKIRLKYTFHVQRKKRTPIETQDQTKIKIFEESLIKFKQMMTEHSSEIFIEFQNDNGHKKNFFIEDALFDQRKINTLENMFSIIMFCKKQTSQNPVNNNSQLQDLSINQIKTSSQNQQRQYSQLIGAISFTNKGLNLWWIKIDQKPYDPNKWCKFFSRKNKKYFAVYEKDPFVSDCNFVGNVVLEDSSKKVDERYAKYTVRRKQNFDMVHFQQRTIEI